MKKKIELYKELEDLGRDEMSILQFLQNNNVSHI